MDTEKTYNKKIEKLRKEIDILDGDILSKIAKRMLVVGEVGKLKNEYHKEALQKERWEQVLKNISKKGEEKKLSGDMVKDIWNTMHKEALVLENMYIMKKDKKR